MAFEGWHIYGYGVRVDDIKTTPEKLVELIKRNEYDYSIVKEYLKERGVEESELKDKDVDIFDDLENEYGAHGVGWFLHETLNGAISFTYATNYEGEEFIVMEPMLPWHYSTIEISLTEEDVKKIFTDCISVLTDEEIKIDYRSIENGC